MKKMNLFCNLSYIIAVYIPNGRYIHVEVPAQSSLFQFSKTLSRAFALPYCAPHKFVFPTLNITILDTPSVRQELIPTSKHVNLYQLGIQKGFTFSVLFEQFMKVSMQCEVLRLQNNPIVKTDILLSNIKSRQQKTQLNKKKPRSRADKLLADLLKQTYLFSKQQLWNKISRNELFAFDVGDHQIHYGCLIGQQNEKKILNIYSTTQGIYGLCLMAKSTNINSPFDVVSQLMEQECLSICLDSEDELFPDELKRLKAFAKENQIDLKKENYYPHFDRFKAPYEPWHVKKPRNLLLISKALEVVSTINNLLTIQSKEELGFSKGDPFGKTIPFFTKENNSFVYSGCKTLPELIEPTYPVGIWTDQIALAKIKKRPVPLQYDCEILPFFMKVQQSEEELNNSLSITTSPYHPWMLFIVDHQTGYLYSTIICKLYDNYEHIFTQKLKDELLITGLPSKLWVPNKRTADFFKDFCEKTGVEMESNNRLIQLETAKLKCAEQMFYQK